MPPGTIETKAFPLFKSVAERALSMALVRCHRGIRPVLPRGHCLYGVPGGRIYLDVRESPMMLARALGLYEPAKIQALRELLEPGATFIDIGANKADFTVLAASIVGPSGRVIAIEPDQPETQI